MAERIRKPKPAPRKREEVAEEAPAPAEADTQAAADKERTEAILDEIDDLMAEIDAEAFVRGFVQKGGQ